MKRTYITPTAEKIEFDYTVQIVASGVDIRPGNGWGDRNHDHTGAPGQKKKGHWELLWRED
ncbi:MAG: hypothetical protein MJZ85_11015 [Bacteroidales bacterium]|nr:hypothetical protein [Bacteroidales bacterium]